MYLNNIYIIFWEVDKTACLVLISFKQLAEDEVTKQFRKVLDFYMRVIFNTVQYSKCTDRQVPVLTSNDTIILEFRD